MAAERKEEGKGQEEEGAQQLAGPRSTALRPPLSWAGCVTPFWRSGTRGKESPMGTDPGHASSLTSRNGRRGGLRS